MIKIVILVCSVLLFCGFVVTEAKAFTYDVQYVSNGITPPSGIWLSATFTTISTGVVDVTFTSNMSDVTDPLPNFIGYKISDIAINIDNSITPSTLMISQQAKSGTFTDPTIYNTMQNAQNVIGSGNLGKGFDIMCSFLTSGSNVFDLADSVTYRISGDSITENSFAYLNSAGTANVGTRFQGYTVSGTSASAYVSNVNVNNAPVPIPPTVFLLGAGLFGLVGLIEKKV